MTQHPDSSLQLVEDVRALLKTRRFGREIRGYPSTPSTNTLATEWAGAGAPEGSVVLAELQTQGRGRLGRSWEAAPGLNLTFSVILYPRLGPERPGLLAMAAAAAVAQAVEHVAAPACVRIKWPNDLLLNGRKACGMLLESSTVRRAEQCPVILGIGLNANQAAFPPELEDRATSLLLETGRPADRGTLLADLLLALEQQYDAVHAAPENVRRQYLHYLADQGQHVTFRHSHTADLVTGVIEGVSKSGALLLRTERGIRTYHAGEITSQLSTPSATAE